MKVTVPMAAKGTKIEFVLGHYSQLLMTGIWPGTEIELLRNEVLGWTEDPTGKEGWKYIYNNEEW